MSEPETWKTNDGATVGVGDTVWVVEEDDESDYFSVVFPIVLGADAYDVDETYSTEVAALRFVRRSMVRGIKDRVSEIAEMKELLKDVRVKMASLDSEGRGR